MASSMSKILRSCRGVLLGIAAFSFVINLLQLAVPLYTWQLFDRVMTSGSHETLMVLTLIAFGALLVAGALEFVRSKALLHVGFWVDRSLSPLILASEVEESARRSGNGSARDLRDLNTIRAFLTGTAVFHLFDVPWLPVFLGVIWLLHPMLGMIAIGGALLLIAVVVVSELATRRRINAANSHRMEALELVDSNLRNAEVVQAMGMLPDLLRRWRETNERCLSEQARASTRGAALHAISRTLRIGMQVSILGTAAYLATIDEVTLGAVIAASTILSRALAPVDQLTSTWQRVVTARFAYRRLRKRLNRWKGAVQRTSLPAPTGLLDLAKVSLSVDGMARPILSDIHFTLVAGQRLGIVGPSGSGKSTLAKVMIGLQKPSSGVVRLDGADVADWSRQELGRHIGYLPQNVSLFTGTVRDNIARMTNATDAEVVAAARLAGVHETVLKLPLGYDTPITNNSPLLSGGQRQLIGLARALFGAPKLLILDEPNANLDRDGETILLDMLDRMRECGITTIVVTHRINVLQHVDWILKLRSGQIDLLGSRDEILRPRASATDSQAPAKVPEADAQSVGRLEKSKGGAD